MTLEEQPHTYDVCKHEMCLIAVKFKKRGNFAWQFMPPHLRRLKRKIKFKILLCKQFSTDPSTTNPIPLSLYGLYAPPLRLTLSLKDVSLFIWFEPKEKRKHDCFLSFTLCGHPLVFLTCLFFSVRNLSFLVVLIFWIVDT